MLKNEGMRVLAERLGPVDAERFIVLLRREPFDYAEWRQTLYKDMPLDEFLKKANEYLLWVHNDVGELFCCVKQNNISSSSYWDFYSPF